MAWFKKKVSAGEFGDGLVGMIYEVIAQDLLKGAARINSGVNLGQPLLPQFQARGVSREQIDTYLRFGIHGCIHIITLPMTLELRVDVVRGALTAFTKPAIGYDFEKAFSDIEGLLQGEKAIGIREFQNLDCDDFILPFMPLKYQKVAATFSKFLLETSKSLGLGIVSVEDPSFDFSYFVSANGATIAAAQRGLLRVEKDFRIT